MSPWVMDNVLAHKIKNRFAIPYFGNPVIVDSFIKIRGFPAINSRLYR